MWSWFASEPDGWAVALAAGTGFALGLALASWRGAAARGEAAGERARLEERTRHLAESLEAARREAQAEREIGRRLGAKLAAADERARRLEERLAESKADTEAQRKRLVAEFESLAARTLDASAKKVAHQNRESLDKLLAPLGEKIQSFRERVEKTHEQGIRDRAALGELLKSLGEQNRRMSEEARNLTQALKGSSKTQGNWGEMLLESALERSGLAAGAEYEMQASERTADGRRHQPDAVVKLPDGKRLVVDAKVSLVAYERSVNAEDEAARQAALREHVASLKARAAELGKKRYDRLFGDRSPDFVLMFVPVEAAFSEAMKQEDGLFDQAFRQGVSIVTPTTLLATLRTVSNIWRQEKQARHARRRGTEAAGGGGHEGPSRRGARAGPGVRAAAARRSKRGERRGSFGRVIAGPKFGRPGPARKADLAGGGRLARPGGKGLRGRLRPRAGGGRAWASRCGRTCRGADRRARRCGRRSSRAGPGAGWRAGARSGSRRSRRART